MPTVLLVEDDDDLREFLRQALPHYGGFTLATAANGVEGLENSLAALPACAVIDVKMPGLNGLQLVRALRGDPATATIPLIILTALPQDVHAFAGLASGADRFIQKPASPSTLATIIQEVIAITEADRAQRYQALAEQAENPAQ
jgi:two-component system phosphate regulon response regulator PhoB